MTASRLALILVLALAAPAGPAAAQGTGGADDAEPVSPPPLSALGAVVFDPAADRVLWGKDEHTGIPMASTTKIMTTLLALEAGTLGDTVTVSRQAAQMGGAGLGLRAGQQIPMRSLLAGLMLRSGNDAATTVAEHVAGTEEDFVARMNARAAELKLRDTRFVNASGLTDDRGHRASPLDLARLTDAAMTHPEFAAWSAARTLTVPGLPPLENRNELIGRYRGANGVKTGYLAHAGLALVASASRDGLTVYAVVLGSQDSFADATRLFDWAFQNYRIARPAGEDAPVGTYRWAGAATPLLAERAVAGAVRRDADVRWRLRVRPVLDSPVAADALLGEAELVEDGQTVASTPLRAGAALTDAAFAGPAAEAGEALEDGLRALARLYPQGQAT